VPVSVCIHGDALCEAGPIGAIVAFAEYQIPVGNICILLRVNVASLRCRMVIQYLVEPNGAFVVFSRQGGRSEERSRTSRNH
jgi:hypothetical protein